MAAFVTRCGTRRGTSKLPLWRHISTPLAVIIAAWSSYDNRVPSESMLMCVRNVQDEGGAVPADVGLPGANSRNNNSRKDMEVWCLQSIHGRAQLASSHPMRRPLAACSVFSLVGQGRTIGIPLHSLLGHVGLDDR